MAVPHSANERGRRRSAPTVSGHDTTDGVFLSAPNDRPGLHVRLFGSKEFFRLWLVQLVGATGDWLGILAVTYLAQSLYPEQSNTRALATSLVIGVRLLPHLFLSPLAGVIVDRFDRRRLMVVADLARVPVLLLLPFARNLFWLVLASLVLEAFTLVWTPAKEAMTPHLVPHDHITTANSLNMAAGFGSFLPGSLVFAILAGASGWLGGYGLFSFLRDGDNQVTLPLVFDALTFLFSAAVLWRLPLPARALGARAASGTAAGSGTRRASGRPAVDVAGALREIKEGWRYAVINPTVRSVNISLGLALMGGGMLVPLGAVFATETLDAGAGGYGLFTTALGFGVAVGVAGITAVQKRVPKARVFSWGLVVSGVALCGAVASTSLSLSVVLLFVMGATAGPVYVLGYSLLHENVDDDMHGRVFAGLNTLVRMCVFLALVLGPLLSAGLDALSNALVSRRLDLGGVSYDLPGVRLTLWLDGLMIVAAGLLARRSVRTREAAEQSSADSHPGGDPGRRAARDLDP